MEIASAIHQVTPIDLAQYCAETYPPRICAIASADGAWACEITEHEGGRVLAFRGSANIADWVADARIAMVKVRFGGVEVEIHEGFAAAWQSLREPVAAYLAAHPDGVNIWTGHSAGGAICLIGAIDLYGGAEAWVATFGQPRTGNQAFKLLCNSLPGLKYIRFVNAADIVTHTPGFLLAGFRHAGEERLMTSGGVLVNPSMVRQIILDGIYLWLARNHPWGSVVELFRDHFIQNDLATMRRLGGSLAQPLIADAPPAKAGTPNL
jgi:hypothetical protein